GWSGSVRCSVLKSPNGCSGDMSPPSNAKNVREESGACRVDTFRLYDYGASTAGSGLCRLYDHWRLPYLHSAGCPCRVGHVGGPAVRGYDVAARLAFVISKSINTRPGRPKIANPTNLGLVGINRSREQGKETPRCGGRWGKKRGGQQSLGVVTEATRVRSGKVVEEVTPNS
ncbi:hypothetical protein BHE74_00057793, partial [Ensete ventricosum]